MSKATSMEDEVIVKKQKLSNYDLNEVLVDLANIEEHLQYALEQVRKHFLLPTYPRHYSINFSNQNKIPCYLINFISCWLI